MGPTSAEGGVATYSVSVKGYVQPAAVVDEVVVTLATPTAGDTAATAGEPADLSTNVPLEFRVDTPAGPASGEGVVGRAFSATGTIRLQTLDDLDAEDEDFNLTFSVEPGGLQDAEADGDPITVDADAPDALTIEDDETQSYDLTTDDDAKEGGADITVTVTANPTHVNGSANLSVQLEAPRTLASITTPATATLEVIDSGNPSRDITIELGDNDKNRVEDTITVTVYSGSVGRATPVDSLSIDVEDIHALPAVAMVVVEDGKALDPQPTSVTEGDTIMVAVMVVDEDGDETNATENLDVALALTATSMADSADYTLAGSFDIMSGTSMSAAVDLEVSTNDDIGMESLMFNAEVSGDSANGPGTRMSAGVLSLTIEDDTTAKITPKTSEADYDAIKAVIAAAAGDDGLNPEPAESFTLTFSDLFTVMDGYTATYSFSQAGTSVSTSSDGESITVTAEMAGRTEITINGTARLPVSSLEGSQTVANDASIKFPVDVVDTELVVMLSAEPMEIEEGGTAMITATANRYVTAGDGAVAIDLTVVGDGTLDANSIMIAMGDMSGSAVLTSTADDDMDNETVTVVATGSGVTGLMQVAVAVTDTTAPVVPEPVPALPLIAQWLLGLGLLGGGARQLFRRRRQG